MARGRIDFRRVRVLRTRRSARPRAAQIWIAGLALVVGCGKLNPDYCAVHQQDTDCIAGGYVPVDAAAPCSADTECTAPDKNVCDVSAHTCVECTPNDHPTCVGDTKVCSTADVCVECVSNADCMESGICLTSSNTCAALDSILHVSPTGSPTSNCSTMAECTLDHAVAIASAAQHVIQIDDGTYTMTDTITLGFEGLHLVPSQGAAPKVTVPNKTVFNVTASVEIDELEIIGTSQTTITCNGSSPLNFSLSQVNVHGSSKDGIDTDNCNLTLDRSRIYANHQSAVNANDSTVAIDNTFFYGNGNNNYSDGAVTFRGNTTGKMAFNTMAYNQGYDQTGYDIHGHPYEIKHAAALTCGQNLGDGPVDLNGNLFVEDNPEPYEINTFFGVDACTGNFTTNNMLAAASDAMFVSTSDLHLTAQTPTGSGKVRDDPSSNCADTGQDFDGDTRPLGGACDYGADEFKSP
jgi:hypothetical protein